MAYCRERSIVNYSETVHTAVSLKCRAWTCPDCADMRKKQLTAECIGGDPDTFLTLTYRVRPDRTPNQAALELSRAWRLCRLRLMRHHKLKHLPFMAVIESTVNGWPHLHILLRSRWLSIDVIRTAMTEIVDSPVVHIRRIDSKGRVAAYCSKYASKAVHKFGTAKRYWQSFDYDKRPDADPKKKPLPGHGWEQHSWSIDRIIQGWKELGWLVKRQSRDRAEAHIRNPWDTS